MSTGFGVGVVIDAMVKEAQKAGAIRQRAVQPRIPLRTFPLQRTVQGLRPDLQYEMSPTFRPPASADACQAVDHDMMF